MKYGILIFYIAGFLNYSACFSQSNQASQKVNIDSSRLNDFFRLYGEAAGKKDYRLAKKYLDTALLIIPDFSNVRYAHARASVRAGLKDEALSDIKYMILQKAIAVKGIQNDSLINAELGNIPSYLDYKKLVTNFDIRNDRSTGAFEIPDKLLIPEGITNDPVRKTIYLGSMYQRKVLTIDNKGIVKDFIKSKQDDVLGVLGIVADAKRRILYFCSSFQRQVILDTNDIKDKRTAVYAYDLTTGKLIHKYNHEKAVFFNDLDIDGDGNVYVTDSESNKIFKINVATKTIDVFIERPRLQSPNGITFNKTGDLFIAAYLGGILKVNMKTGMKTWIRKPDSISLAGNDGMEWYENSLIINSPIEHKAVRRLYLDKEQTAVIKEEVLAYDPTIISECTTGTIMNNEFYFIANSGLDAYERNGSLNTTKLKNPVIRKIKLKK